MAKRGMRRYTYDNDKSESKNSVAPVPEIQGKAKLKDKKVRPIIAGTETADVKVFHDTPHKEKPISSAYSTIDTDLGRDNLENNTSQADLQDL